MNGWMNRWIMMNRRKDKWKIEFKYNYNYINVIRLQNWRDIYNGSEIRTMKRTNTNHLHNHGYAALLLSNSAAMLDRER